MERSIIEVAGWNIEHFRGDPARVERAIGFVRGNDGGPRRVPDVLALFEVEGKRVFHDIVEALPEHSFHLTEGKQTQEILVAVRREMQWFATQRMEFKTGRDHLRPGLLLTLKKEGKLFSLLLLHIKAGSSPEDFGLRDAALVHAFNLKKALDRAGKGRANFAVLGDLNTVGVDDTVPYGTVLDQKPEKEIARLADWAERRGMVLHRPDREHTWWNGSGTYAPAHLDHVIAAEHLEVTRPGNKEPGTTVLGWPKLEGDERRKWIETFSDHAMLSFELGEGAGS